MQFSLNTKAIGQPLRWLVCSTNIPLWLRILSTSPQLYAFGLFSFIFVTHLNFQCTGTSACHKTCANEELDCYILDNNGFIIISENNDHTGRFFGQIDGTIMDSLVQDRIYKKVPVYDYQGACTNSRSHYSGKGHQVSVSLKHNININYIAYIFLSSL